MLGDREIGDGVNGLLVVDRRFPYGIWTRSNHLAQKDPIRIEILRQPRPHDGADQRLLA